SWYDAAFARQWTNGVFLLNAATNRLLTEADISSSGAADRYVVWDQTSDKSVIYDAASGKYDRDRVMPALFGARVLKGNNGKEFLPKAMAAVRIGRERKPLGPPAKPGNCAAYDVFTAILEEKPYPVKALLNFGSNTIMSNADSRRGREAMKKLELAVAVDLFM